MLAVGVAHHLAALHPPGRLGESAIGLRAAVAVGGVHGRITAVLVAHRAVLVVAVDGRLGLVDRQLEIVGADPVTVRVRVAEQPPEQHLVRAGADPANEIGGLERRLLHLGEVVLRVAVEHHPPHRDRRVVAMRPDLGQIERVKPVIGRVGERHDLHLQPPLGRVAPGDRVVEIANVEVRLLGDHRLGLVVGEALDPLDGLEVVLDPELVAARVLPQEGVAAVAVHVAPAARRAAIAHQEADLMSRLGRERPEVPLRVVAAQVRVRHPLLGVNEVLELRRS